MEETPVIRPEHAARYDAICAMLIRFNPQSLGPEKPRLKVIARFGVGYDTIDVPTCQKAGIFLTIAPDGVRRPVAMSAITFMLMLAHKAYRQGCEAIFNISFDVSLLYLKRFLFY